MFSREEECVCVQGSEKNMGDTFFFWLFEGERVVGVTCFVTFFVCFWWFIGDGVF
jgi:hypothetical protein